MKASGARVVRGGSFYNFERDVRAAARLDRDPSYRYDDVGFRVVVSRFRSLASAVSDL